MILYKTLKEKAEEWNVSLRHIQYLCKEGRIDGAIKKAGAWFIPDNVPMPTQYTKSKNGQFHFVGTKKKIFHCAIELFQQRGFEAVSMKDLADAVGISQSSVYNHFRSKQKILDTIYEFYRYYFLKDRPGMEEIELILQNGSLVDIIRSVHYEFNEEHIRQMAYITIIIFHRSAIDEQAREVTRSLMIDEGVRFVEAVFNRAVEIGRIAPLDTHTMSLLINSIRLFKLHCWLSGALPETHSYMEEEETKLYQMASLLLTDLKPPTAAPD